MFVNNILKQVVLAHRGTSSDEEKATDFYVVLGLNPKAIEVKHSYHATQEALEYSLKEGYYLSVTGHSLGGFYSELSAFKISNYAHNILVPPRVVTFDSPGAFEFLKSTQEANGIASSRVSSDAFKNLGVVNYCLGPNLINTVNQHLGTVIFGDYRKLGIPIESLVIDEAIIKAGTYVFHLVHGEEVYNTIKAAIEFTKSTHGIDQIIKIFDPSTGKAKESLAKIANDWPKLNIDTNIQIRDERAVVNEFTKFYENVLSILVSCIQKKSAEGCSYKDQAAAVINTFFKVDFSKITKSHAFKLLAKHGSWYDSLQHMGYDHNIDLFWPDIKNKHWSKDPIIARLHSEYNDFQGSSCGIFQIDIYQEQCNLLIGDITLSKYSYDDKSVDIVKTVTYTPNQIRDWFSKIAMISEYAAYKLDRLLNDSPDNIVKVKLAKSNRNEFQIFESRQKALNDIINQKLDAKIDWTDYLICGGGGIGKSVFMNSLASKLDHSKKPKYWISDGDLVAGISKLFETIFIAGDDWMMYNSLTFEENLINHLRINSKLLSNIIFIIDNLDFEKLDRQLPLFQAMAAISNARFIISSEECELAHKIGEIITRSFKMHAARYKLAHIKLEPPSHNELVDLFNSHLRNVTTLIPNNVDTDERELGNILNSTGALPINFMRALDFSANLYGEQFDKFMRLLDNLKTYKYNSIRAILEFLRPTSESPEIFKLLTGLLLISNPQVIAYDEYETSDIEGESFDTAILCDLFGLISSVECKPILELLEKARIIDFSSQNNLELSVHKGVLIELYKILQEEQKEGLQDYLTNFFDNIIRALEHKLLNVSIYNFGDNKHYQKSLVIALKSFIDESIEWFATYKVSADPVAFAKVLKKFGQIMELSSQNDAITYYSEAIKILSLNQRFSSEENILVEAKLNFQLGEVFYGLMNLPRAISHYERAFNLLDNANNESLKKYIGMILYLSKLQIGSIHLEPVIGTWIPDFNTQSLQTLSTNLNEFPSIALRNAAVISDMLSAMPNRSEMAMVLLPVASSYLRLLNDFRNSYKESFIPHLIELDLEIVQLAHTLKQHDALELEINSIQKLDKLFSNEASIGIFRADSLLRGVILEGHYTHENCRHSKGVSYLDNLILNLRQSFNETVAENVSRTSALFLAQLINKALLVSETFLNHAKLNYELCPLNPNFQANQGSWLDYVSLYAKPAFAALLESFHMSTQINDKVGIKLSALNLIKNFSMLITTVDQIPFSLEELVKIYLKNDALDALFHFPYICKKLPITTLEKLAYLIEVLSVTDAKSIRLEAIFLNKLGKDLTIVEAPYIVKSAVYGLAYEFLGSSPPLLRQEIITGYIENTLNYCLTIDNNFIRYNCGKLLKSIALKELKFTSLHELLDDIEQYSKDINYSEEQYLSDLDSFGNSLSARSIIDEQLYGYYDNPALTREALQSYEEYYLFAQMSYFNNVTTL